MVRPTNPDVKRKTHRNGKIFSLLSPTKCLERKGQGPREKGKIFERKLHHPPQFLWIALHGGLKVSKTNSKLQTCAVSQGHIFTPTPRLLVLGNTYSAGPEITSHLLGHNRRLGGLKVFFLFFFLDGSLKGGSSCDCPTIVAKFLQTDFLLPEDRSRVADTEFNSDSFLQQFGEILAICDLQFAIWSP